MRGEREREFEKRNSGHSPNDFFFAPSRRLLLPPSARSACVCAQKLLVHSAVLRPSQADKTWKPRGLRLCGWRFPCLPRRFSFLSFSFLREVKLSKWLFLSTLDEERKAEKRKKTSFRTLSVSLSLSLAGWTPRGGASPRCASSSQEEQGVETTGEEPRHRHRRGRRWLSPLHTSPLPLPRRRLGPRHRPTPGEEGHSTVLFRIVIERTEKESSSRSSGDG